MKQENDILYRFIFQQQAVRGEITRLTDSYVLAINRHDYPLPIEKLLGEMLAVTVLLTASLKFTGQISLQIQGEGPLELAVVNGDDQQQIRSVARYQGEISDNFTLLDLVGDNAILAISITPEQGERYQGIVRLEFATLAENIQQYFYQSEQLATQIILYAGNYNNIPIATGMLLQVLPNADSNNEEFSHLAQLTATITADELYTLPIHDILYRLYHQEQVEVFPPQQISFKCGCSREKSIAALMLLSDQEIQDVITSNENINMSCDYCNCTYSFTTAEIQAFATDHQRIN